MRNVNTRKAACGGQALQGGAGAGGWGLFCGFGAAGLQAVKRSGEGWRHPGMPLPRLDRTLEVVNTAHSTFFYFPTIKKQLE